MNIDFPNHISFLAPVGSRIWFRSAFFPDPTADQPYIPPCPLGSPFARLWHGCYWMKCRTQVDTCPIQLVGPQATGRFVCQKVESGRAIFVSPAHLAGFVQESGSRGFETLLSHLLEPASWALRRPLPMVFHGPGTVILYGENLQTMELPATENFERPSHMIAAFDAASAFKVHPANPGRPDMAMWENIFGAEVYQALPQHRWVVVEQVYRPRFGLGLIKSELLLHLGVIAAAWWLSSQ